MFMDLYEKDAATALQPQPNEAHSLPGTGEAAFGAAWNEAKLFSQSVAGANARASVLQDYISEIRQKTGADLSKELMALTRRRRLCAFPGCRIMAPSESGKSIWKISHDRPDTISRNRHALGQRSRTGASRVRDHGV
jgi:hypothetical protein